VPPLPPLRMKTPDALSVVPLLLYITSGEPSPVLFQPSNTTETEGIQFEEFPPPPRPLSAVRCVGGVCFWSPTEFPSGD